MPVDIGAKIGIDGASEFKRSLNTIKKASKELASEMKLVTSSFDENDSAQDKLTAQSGVLTKQIDVQKQKISLLSEDYDKAVKKLNELGVAAKSAAKEYGENSKEAIKASTAYDKQAQNVSRTKTELNKAETALNGMERELKQNTEALNQMDSGLKNAKTGIEEVEEASSGLEKTLGVNLGSAVRTAAAGLSAGIAAIFAGLGGAAESSREYRTEMGKLNTAFTTSGFSAKSASGAYKEIYSILGEEDTSVEAANHLAKLTDNEKELAKWTGNILPGVFATFGDSLPIEGLTEAANETAKVGKVTGPLADALNWAGVSEDKFNESLAACSTEQERQALITETLNGIYGEASEKYKTMNKDIIEANKAQARMTDAIAKIGGAVEPMVTSVKNGIATVIEKIADLIIKFTELPKGAQIAVGGIVGLISSIGPALLIYDKMSGSVEKLKEIISDITGIFGKKVTATALDTAATSANTTVTNANATATTLAAKAKTMLTKALGVGKWLLLAGAIAGVTALLIAFTKDGNGATQMVQGFADKISAIISKTAEMLPAIVSAFSQMLPAIINAGVQILMALVEGITTAIPVLTQMLPQILMTIVNAITANLPTIINAAIQIIIALIQGITNALPTLIAAIPQVISAITAGITENLPTIINGAIEIIIALIQGLIQALPQLIAALPQIIFAIVTGLISMAGQIFNVGLQLLQKLWSGISSWVGNLFSKVSGFAEKIPGKIKDGLGSLVSVGGDWVKGLWNGISNKVDWILGKIKGFGKSVLNGLKKIFKIKSPSKETEEMGMFLGEGLGIGFKKSLKKVSNEMQIAATGALNGVKKAGTIAQTQMDMGIDYDRLEKMSMRGIYIDGRLIGRALRKQGVIFE